MLNTKLEVPSVGFLVAGLDCAKFGFYQFPSFLFIVVIVISILVKQESVTGENFIADEIPFKTIEKYRYGLRKTVSKHLKSVKKFLDKEKRTAIPFNSRSRSPPCPSHLLCFISRC